MGILNPPELALRYEGEGGEGDGEAAALLGALSTWSFPPIASTRRLQIVRPRPVPLLRSRSGFRSWKNSSKMCAGCSGAMPMPVSVDARWHVIRRRCGWRRRDVAALGELDRVADQVAEDARRA